MKSVTAFLFLATLAGLAVQPRDASACSTLGERPITISAADGDVPVDAPIGVIVTVTGAFSVTVRSKDGTEIPVTVVAAPEPRLQWIRPATGDFPEGPMKIVVRAGVSSDEANVRGAGKIADYRLSVDAPALSSEVAPDDASPKIRCGREGTPEDSCGPREDADLASRWRRAPRMTFVDHDPSWVKTTFGTTNRWTVRHSDGTVDTEISTTNDHRFASVGVEYCVETMRAPMPGIAASPKSDRHCIQDDGAAFTWSDAENEAQLVSTSKSWGCKTLDFPPGTDVPEELEDEAAEGQGCDIGSGSRGTGGPSVLVAAAISVLLVRRRRSRATVHSHDGVEGL